MTTKRTGGCACGAIRYEISAEPMISVLCQCRDCQRASGSGHATGMAFPRSAVSLRGDIKYYDVRADSGNMTGRGFCPHCGSPVTARTSGLPDLTMITAGSLDDPSGFQPQGVIWNKSACAWDDTGSLLPRFETMPPMGNR